MKETEIIGIKKIVFYPKEVFAIHYKGKPFSISNLSYKEQRELGVAYPSIGSVNRKCYFTEGNAKIGIKQLPKEIRDKLEIVKYVPVIYQQEKTNIIMEKIQNHCKNCPCNYDCKHHNLDEENCVIEDIINILNDMNIK